MRSFSSCSSKDAVVIGVLANVDERDGEGEVSDRWLCGLLLRTCGGDGDCLLLENTLLAGTGEDAMDLCFGVNGSEGVFPNASLDAVFVGDAARDIFRRGDLGVSETGLELNGSYGRFFGCVNSGSCVGCCSLSLEAMSGLGMRGIAPRSDGIDGCLDGWIALFWLRVGDGETRPYKQLNC